MVDCLFFCATLTGHRGDHTSFVQAEAETSDTSAEGLSQTQAFLGRVCHWHPPSFCLIIAQIFSIRMRYGNTQSSTFIPACSDKVRDPTYKLDLFESYCLTAWESNA